MSDKLGTYITKVMTIAIDKNQDEIVKTLALDELKRLNANIGEFLDKSLKDEMGGINLVSVIGSEAINKSLTKINKDRKKMEKETKEKPCCVKNKCKSKKEKQLLQEEK